MPTEMGGSQSRPVVNVSWVIPRARGSDPAASFSIGGAPHVVICGHTSHLHFWVTIVVHGWIGGLSSFLRRHIKKQAYRTRGPRLFFRLILVILLHKACRASPGLSGKVCGEVTASQWLITTSMPQQCIWSNSRLRGPTAKAVWSRSGRTDSVGPAPTRVWGCLGSGHRAVAVCVLTGLMPAIIATRFAFRYSRFLFSIIHDIIE